MLTAEELIEQFGLERHQEGGWFGETYTTDESSGLVQGDRPLAGSIYFLLNGKEISHFHEIDCEEIWYYHCGCGMKIWIITKDGRLMTQYLGLDCQAGQVPMVVIPKGAIFAAQNIDEDDFTFVSCVTAPKFRYSGFRLVAGIEVACEYPDLKGIDERLFIY